MAEDLHRGEDLDGHQHERRTQTRRAVIVGGGLAGLSVACELADLGHQVTLLEKRPYLGGKVYSFRQQPFGEIDNGQHIFLRCCTAYVGFLKKLGVLGRTRLQSRLSIPVVGVGGRRSILGRAPLPPPFHLSLAIARYRHLSPKERAAVLIAVFAMRGISDRDRTALDGVNFRSWLEQHGQSARAIGRLWDLIVLPTLNDDSSKVSAAQAIMVFQEAFLRRGDAADVGLAEVGLSAVCYAEAKAYIEARGGQVLLGTAVAALEGSSEGIQGARTNAGDVVQGDVYVVALPPRETLALLPKGFSQDAFFLPASRLKASPIVNLYLLLSKPVAHPPFAAYLESKIQWVFNKGGGRLVASVSGAHEYIDMPKQALYELLLRDFRNRVPGCGGAEVVDYAIVHEREATFTAEPGSAAWRLSTRTPVPNLFLAGAWTDTGWPATMEGAVRSGVSAAREVNKSPWPMR